METAKIAEPISGNKLYQQRARKALPLLVRQAEAGVPIYYSDLAHELGMANARNLNYVLGSIGNTLVNLSRAWGEEVPPIQALVVNKGSLLPGSGIHLFFRKMVDYRALSKPQRVAYVTATHKLIHAFARWRDVLRVLDLNPAETHYVQQMAKAAKLRIGGVESEAHRLFKEFVAANPASVGLPKKTSPGLIEHCFPSDDKVDVLFKGSKKWIAVEVKSQISDEPDIMRGLFQCVKYLALTEAEQTALGLSQNARAILALEGKLPTDLISLRNMLGIEVMEHVCRR